MMYLSEESLDAGKKEPTWTKREDEEDAEGLQKLVKQKHKIRASSEVKENKKFTARANYQMIIKWYIKDAMSQSYAYEERFN